MVRAVGARRSIVGCEVVMVGSVVGEVGSEEENGGTIRCSCERKTEGTFSAVWRGLEVWFSDTMPYETYGFSMPRRVARRVRVGMHQKLQLWSPVGLSSTSKLPDREVDISESAKLSSERDVKIMYH